MHKTFLTTDSHDAKSVAKSLNVDNVNEENLKVKTRAHGKKIKTDIKTNSISALLNTLDDIIHCQILAEKTIKSGNC